MDEVNEVHPFLICTICTNVLIDPKECKVCHNAFCGLCLERWLERKNECPNQCKGSRFKQPHPYVLESLAKLQTNC